MFHLKELLRRTNQYVQCENNASCSRYFSLYQTHMNYLGHHEQLPGITYWPEKAVIESQSDKPASQHYRLQIRDTPIYSL